MATKAQQLEKELTQAFPELKFSVKTEKRVIHYIRLTVTGLLGSSYTKHQIEAIANKYNKYYNDEALAYVTIKNVDGDSLYDEIMKMVPDYKNNWKTVHKIANNEFFTVLPDRCYKETDNELKADNELSFSEKRQVELVDWLLGEPAPVHETSSLDSWSLGLIPQSPIRTEASTLSELIEELDKENKQLKESVKSLAFSRENDYQECLKHITSETAHFNKCIKQLQEEYQVLERKNQELERSKEYSQAWVDNLQQRVHDLECAVYLLQQENKQLKDQSEAKLEPQLEPTPEPKPTTKKRPKFKLPECFADYQQECDDLINALSCFYDIKKGKWGKDIFQFILTPTDTERTKLPYPDKWKAGLYLQPGQWTIDKVKLSDPDEWEEWFMDVNDFADSNEIEIS